MASVCGPYPARFNFSRVPKNVSVGDIPFAVAVNPTRNRAYVLTYADSRMYVIDGRTGDVTTTVQLATRPSAIAVTLAWSVGVTYVLLKLVSAFVPLRVSMQQELEGLDISQQGESLQ